METIAKLPIQNTSKLLNKDTHFCGLVWAPPKTGKTTLGATLDTLTRKFKGKPTLFIACEAGEGGGTASIKDYKVDYVVPTSKNELEAIISCLQTDTTYGGVVLDGTLEVIKRFIQPYALTFPSREKVATRAAGVPERSDYQTMGEVMRELLNRLIGLTTITKVVGGLVVLNSDCRKHLLVTALERVREDDNRGILSIGPDLPGAMATTATAMFQVVLNLQIREKMERTADGKGATRSYQRVLVSQSDGKRVVGDRFNVFPAEVEPDLALVWEKYWVPRISSLGT